MDVRGMKELKILKFLKAGKYIKGFSFLAIRELSMKFRSNRLSFLKNASLIPNKSIIAG
jgi:hypothetical protein